jgi:hypothetical protein
MDLPDFLQKRCRRLKPARNSYNHLPRTGLILFRPDGLTPAPGYQFHLPKGRRLRVGNVLMDLPDFLQKRCRRLKPARDSHNQLTQDLRPGLILFRPDGLASAPAYQFHLSHARRLRVGNALIDLPDFQQKRCRRLKPARDSYNQPTQDSTTPTSPPRRGARWGPRSRPGLILFRPDGLAPAPSQVGGA